MLEGYIESLAVKGFTDDTQHVRREHLCLFERWAMERGLTEPVEVTRPVLDAISVACSITAGRTVAR
jgi:integrase/recombinase XerD